MTSSLASQLSGIRSLNAARLATPSSLSSHSSYLFPPRIAATHDLDTVYSLAETGWTEVCLEDARCEKWTGAEVLFGAEAKTTDRTQLSKEENEKIDQHVEQFLRLVGPVLLGKSAAKCLEWLVRRYR